jgi:hypothetical protein
MIESVIYLHGSKERNYETAIELGLSEHVGQIFAYTCYEVAVKLEIDESTGEAMATHFNGVKLEYPVKV